MLRLRFSVNAEDYRPVKFPPSHPYWCTGYSVNNNFECHRAIIVAYADSVDQIYEFWPDAEDIAVVGKRDDYIFTTRFPKPEMTLDEFFEALKNTPRDWKLEPWCGQPRIRRNAVFAQQCPLTAVAKFGEREEYYMSGDTRYWRAAARKIKLKKSDALKILHAADGRGTLRERLLAACGL